ncbi:hypothetical protein [Tateyamaria sp.]
MYKQVVKTGRFKGTAQEYAQKREAALMYSKILGSMPTGLVQTT